MLLLASWRAATSLALLSRRENSSASEFLSHMDLWTNQHLGFNYTPVKTHFIKRQQMANAAHMAEFWNVTYFVLPSYFITSKSETGCMPKITDVPCQISDLKDKHVLTASVISSYLFPEHCGFVMFSASAYSMLKLFTLNSLPITPENYWRGKVRQADWLDSRATEWASVVHLND